MYVNPVILSTDQKSTEFYISSKSNHRWIDIVCGSIVHSFTVRSWERKRCRPNEWTGKKINREENKRFTVKPFQWLLYIKWITNVHFVFHRITRSSDQATIQALSCVFCSLFLHFYCLNSSYVCLCKSMFTTSINVAPQLYPILRYLIVIYFHYLPFVRPSFIPSVTLTHTLCISLPCNKIHFTLYIS